MMRRHLSAYPLVTDRLPIILGATLALMLWLALPAFAHDVSERNAGYIESISGVAPIPFLYLGAKHMVTGIDHVLFGFSKTF